MCHFQNCALFTLPRSFHGLCFALRAVSIFFLTYIEKFKLFLPLLAKIHFIIFLLTGVAIYFSFAVDYTEGREYFAFAPILMIPILIGWMLFGINYFKTLYKNVKGWPVYYWSGVQESFLCAII